MDQLMNFAWKFMLPMVLINQIVTEPAGSVLGSEGCLSFPEIYADISRPGTVDVKALDAKGKPGALLVSGTGDVIEPDEGVMAIGSGGPYAQAAARALLDHTELAPADIVIPG